jgi:hypothetical protein
MEHALSSQQGASAKLERNHPVPDLASPAAAKRLAWPCGGALFFCFFGYVFLIHDLRSWFPFLDPAAGASLAGA